MTQRKVVTGAKFVQEVRDEFYFSSQAEFGGGAALGDQVVIVSEQTGNILALGTVVAEGTPRAECKSVKVFKRFE